MSIDFGDNPVGTPPTSEQLEQIKSVLVITSGDIIDSTVVGRNLLSALDVSAQQAALELGSAALLDTGDAIGDVPVWTDYFGAPGFEYPDIAATFSSLRANYIADPSNFIALDATYRQLVGIDGSTVFAEWGGSQINFPFGAMFGSSVDAGSYDFRAYYGQFDYISGYNGISPPSFPQGAAMGSSLEMGGYAIYNADLVQAGFGRFDDIQSASGGSAPLFPYGAGMQGNLDMGGFDISSCYNIYSTYGNFNYVTAPDFVLSGLGGLDFITDQVGLAPPILTFGAIFNPMAVASLPPTPSEGTQCYVNDADLPLVGSVLGTGGSTYKCIVVYNGTDWMVTALV